MLDHLTSPIAGVLALTLLHFIWQGALIAAVYWGILEATEVRSVRMRYVLSLATLCFMAVSPIVTFLVINDSASVNRMVTLFSERSVATDTASVAASECGQNRPAQLSGGLADLPADRGPLSSDRGSENENRGGKIALTEFEFWRVADAIYRSRPYVLLLWLAGVMLSGARLTAGLLNVVWLRSGRQPVPIELKEKAQRLARQIGLATARVFSSDRVRTAAVAGFWKPVVLLPTSWLMSLPPDVVEAVIAHELAHIRRLDVWATICCNVLSRHCFFITRLCGGYRIAFVLNAR